MGSWPRSGPEMEVHRQSMMHADVSEELRRRGVIPQAASRVRARMGFCYASTLARRPRAADDFPRERARPRAADDFAMIRARMEELRRERAQLLLSRPCRYRQSRDAGRGTE
jgi:hypothetical protein